MHQHPLYISLTAFDVLAVVASIGMLACWLVVLPRGPVARIDAAMSRLLGIAAALLTASSIGILAARTLEMEGGHWAILLATLPLVLKVTHYGHVWLFRLPALVLLWLGWLRLGRHERRAWPAWLMLAAVAGIALTRSETGHPADHGDFTLAVWIDWVHLLAGSVWVGSLLGMSLAVFPQLLTGEPDPAPRAAEIFGRLSRLAGIALGVVVLSGVITAWHELRAWSALWDSQYGRILSVKLLLVAGMIGLGARNRYGHLPRLQVLSGQTPRQPWLPFFAFKADKADVARPAAVTAVRECSRTVSTEALLGLAVIVAASALLHGMPPADMPHTAAMAAMSGGSSTSSTSSMSGMSMAPTAGPVPALGRHRWIDWPAAQAYVRRSAHAGHVDRAGRVHFRGGAVTLNLVAVQPHYPDMSFELADRVNPTIVVPAGARVTLHLLNMDYGPGMDHGVIVTAVGPPYPVLGMERLHPRLAMLDPIPSRSAESLSGSRYAEASVRFTVPEAPGTYYYACQWPGHAEGDHMYGKFEVRATK